MLLGSSGRAIVCPGCPEEPAIRVDATGQSTEIPLPYERVNDIASFPGGDRILAATSSEKGKRSQLLVLSSESLAPLGRVEIPGNGERLVVAPDGYAAFVISHRPARGADAEAGDWELLAIDLGKSQVASSYPLPSPAFDLALSEDGTRLFVGLEGKIQSFTTAPLTASWFFLSPGRNLRLKVRPRQGEVYVLRDARIAIFPREPRKAAAGEGARDDDASAVLDTPSHADRFGFSRDGRIAVAAGRGMDVLIIIDATRAKIAGTWPEEASTVRTLLAEADAAEKPKGPRGKLVAQQKGYAPPLGGAAPGATAKLDASSSTPGSAAPAPPGNATSEPAQISRASSPPSPDPSSDKRIGGAPGSNAPRADPSPTRGSAGPALTGDSGSSRTVKEPQASPPGMSTAPERITDKPLVVPDHATEPQRRISPEEASLEEVEGSQIKGRIGGDFSSVGWVVLYGPDNILVERDRVEIGPDGSFAFKLPAKGKYRIVPAAKSGFTLVTRPSFQTLEIGGYGFSGVDFSVIKSVRK